MKVGEAYKNLVKYARNRGAPVRHAPKKNVYGCYSLTNHIITIRKNLKGTKLGCRVLAHEIGHHEDFCSKKFPDFFNGKPKNLKEVCEAEVSASKNGQKLLLELGIKVDYEEFDYKNNAYLLEFYEYVYGFDKRKNG